jgi:hypothetical protein
LGGSRLAHWMWSWQRVTKLELRFCRVIQPAWFSAMRDGCFKLYLTSWYLHSGCECLHWKLSLNYSCALADLSHELMFRSLSLCLKVNSNTKLAVVSWYHW